MSQETLLFVWVNSAPTMASYLGKDGLLALGVVLWVVFGAVNRESEVTCRETMMSYHSVQNMSLNGETSEQLQYQVTWSSGLEEEQVARSRSRWVKVQGWDWACCHKEWTCLVCMKHRIEAAANKGLLLKNSLLGQPFCFHLSSSRCSVVERDHGEATGLSTEYSSNSATQRMHKHGT